jgi:hypothetical protein
MNLHDGWIQAEYVGSIIDQYRNNPFIECLPPIKNATQVSDTLKMQINFRASDIYLDGNTRIHAIAQLIDHFFQPLTRHIELEMKISLMIRQGYIGRNLIDGGLNAHIQNGYERIMTGKLAASQV